jgi:hypothetical protein
MQIDFHHATTYVAARLAGFAHGQADIVAHAAQYVDDATSSGLINFDQGPLYSRISSAHKTIDVRNKADVMNHLVWVPFHFLPGNEDMDETEGSNADFAQQLVCTPDSPIARRMIRQAILERDRPYGLHRLGVTMHVYADTWAHQGFAGILDKINEVEDIEETSASGVFSSGLKRFINDILDDAIPPLGHGRATIFPDMPFLSWTYLNGHKQFRERNNTDDFCEASDQMCRAMERYIKGDPDADTHGIGSRDMATIRDLFTTLNLESGEKRHARWLDAIADGAFSFGRQTISYPGKGPGSWKEQALGSSRDKLEYRWTTGFLKSDWKYFHDAVQAHRFYVLHDLLPRFGICAA